MSGRSGPGAAISQRTLEWAWLDQGELQGSPVGQALSGHKQRIPLAVVLPRPYLVACYVITVLQVSTNILHVPILAV